MLRAAFASLAAVLTLAAPFAASAQDAYPSRPVKFVVPFPAGGPLDVPARLVAQKLTELWGKPVIVENQAGASGSIGANTVARAEPDGYTLLVTVDIPLTMYPAVAKKLPYDPQADFRPVGIFARLQNGLFLHPSVPAANVGELVALAKKQPGKLTFSSAGIASPAHFAGELFKVIAGIDLVHIPYKGAAPAMSAALAGEVSMMFGPTTQGAPHVRTGKLKLLGVTGPRPSGVLPEAAPLSQQGFPGLVVFNWEGVAAPAKTPDAVVETISAGWNRVMGDAGVRAKLAAMDLEPTWDGPEVMRRAMAEDLKRWAELANRARIEAPN
jgi:tripartite-type tricarboxylate transporter receptor subunit TctC